MNRCVGLAKLSAREESEVMIVACKLVTKIRKVNTSTTYYRGRYKVVSAKNLNHKEEISHIFWQLFQGQSPCMSVYPRRLVHGDKGDKIVCVFPYGISDSPLGLRIGLLINTPISVSFSDTSCFSLN